VLGDRVRAVAASCDAREKRRHAQTPEEDRILGRRAQLPGAKFPEGHYDPGSPEDAPRWYGVHVKLDKIFSRYVPLEELRGVPALANMVLLRRGRLSVQPVTAAEFAAIVRLGGGG
jgi:hypothetical protein